MPKINKYGDRGSPCLSLLEGEKLGPRPPFKSKVNSTEERLVDEINKVGMETKIF